MYTPPAQDVSSLTKFIGKPVELIVTKDGRPTKRFIGVLEMARWDKDEVWLSFTTSGANPYRVYISAGETWIAVGL